MNNPSNEETREREEAQVDQDGSSGSARPTQSDESTEAANDGIVQTDAGGDFKTPASPERATRRGRAAVRMPERDEPAAPACEITIRASERIPSPVRGPSVAAPVREVVREETAVRTEVLTGTILDARSMRVPRAGECW
jgi:hypothetical protein